MILTGFEIKEKTKKHDSLIDESLYNYEEIEKDGVIIQTIVTAIMTEQELTKNQNLTRIAELEILIEKKKLRGYDYSVELQELEQLDPIL